MQSWQHVRCSCSPQVEGSQGRRLSSAYHPGSELKRRLFIGNVSLRECMAEFLGTFLLLAFGFASVAQLIIGNGSLVSVNFAWGFSVSIAVWVTGTVSGAHINPAVTVASATVGRFSWRKVPHYLLGQYLGGFVASFVVWAVYFDAINNYDGGVRVTNGTKATAAIFTTFPKPYLTVMGALKDQLLATGLLMMGILAMTDPRNTLRPPPGLLPLCVGFIVTAIGMCFCLNMGYPINPARDLPSRIFIALAGWGKEPFSVNNYNYFWIPVVGPHLGAILGAVLYELCIGLQLPDVDPKTPLKKSYPKRLNTFFSFFLLTQLLFTSDAHILHCCVLFLIFPPPSPLYSFIVFLISISLYP
ncbi:hypothetical protein NP493_769g00011 [Ridgeia piscesae]|uniref:Uncharacterized protein n=1 Tax=Ridgeia piscesae TaxID=27915 RepID=A0AAD9NLY7_RIDPI|nr:hypothetical protein NP493_769g00011 [Ridgeia piscesae]